MSQRSNLQLENAILRREAEEFDAILAEAAEAIADLEARLAQATQAYKALAAKQPKAKPPRPVRVPTPDELARVERMAKAKALAMASGDPVLA